MQAMIAKITQRLPSCTEITISYRYCPSRRVHDDYPAEPQATRQSEAAERLELLGPGSTHPLLSTYIHTLHQQKEQRQEACLCQLQCGTPATTRHPTEHQGCPYLEHAALVTSSAA